jgi:hypothetical protein
MESNDIERVRHMANTDTIRRLLIKYFMDKGYDKSFDLQVYPRNLQDLTSVIPVLSSKIEITPHCIDIDTALGRAVLGWNMFALGDQRMYLGETYHNNLHDLASQIKQGMMGNSGDAQNQNQGQATRTTTPRKIVAFITRVFGHHKSGYIDLSPTGIVKQPGEAYVAKQTLNAVPGQYFGRSGYG